eukprot:scaffold89477_cov27-Tisochrysis_lutea.AAC.2
MDHFLRARGASPFCESACCGIALATSVGLEAVNTACPGAALALASRDAERVTGTLGRPFVGEYDAAPAAPSAAPHAAAGGKGLVAKFCVAARLSGWICCRRCMTSSCEGARVNLAGPAGGRCCIASSSSCCWRTSSKRSRDVWGNGFWPVTTADAFGVGCGAAAALGPDAETGTRPTAMLGASIPRSICRSAPSESPPSAERAAALGAACDRQPRGMAASCASVGREAEASRAVRSLRRVGACATPAAPSSAATR